MNLLADLVLLLHAAFIVFVVLGGLVVFRHEWLAWLHLPAVAWAVYIEIAGSICPLTPLENYLREQAGGGAYETGFIEHYIAPLVYPAGLTPGIQYLLAAFVLAVNIPVYLYLLHTRKKRQPGR